MANKTEKPHIDVKQRLEQWKLEATDPQHPNNHDADLEHPARLHAVMSSLLSKLQNTPESFDQEDALSLFGALNSGQRTKTRVVAENSLPELRTALLTMLYGDGTPAIRIQSAQAAIRWAGSSMLGELYGWAHADMAPLYNECAADALAYLGYEFEPGDYDSFVAAHEQFKQVYQQDVGQLRPDLPLNLEIDKLYNVIDKVDLKQPTEPLVLGTPFDQLFADWQEAQWAFDLLEEAAERLGLTGPEDPIAAFNLRYKGGAYHLRLSYGTWLILGFSGNGGSLHEVDLALLTDRVELEPLERQAFTQQPGEASVALHLFPPNALDPLPDNIRTTYEITLDQIKERFSGRRQSLHRRWNKPPVAAAVFDRVARERLLRDGFEFEEPTAEQPTPPEASQFTPRTLPIDHYDRQAFLARTYLSSGQADDLYELLREKRQIILYGPPGTGKTYVAQELSRWVTGLVDPPADRVEMIQFHPAYSYEDFIEGIRPESKPTEGGRFTVDYPPRSGVFRRFCTAAQADPDRDYVFIIDEINRGNIPRIFGELMLLLEYRDRDVPLPYSGKRFQIPPNVYLIGTMNTADRSIALVDFALRRRFHFFHFGADPDLLERWLAEHPPRVRYLARLYRRLSEEAIDDPNYAVGPSYFMEPGLTGQKLKRIWQYSIEPYLEEYFVDQPARLNRWRWDSDFLRGIRGES